MIGARCPRRRLMNRAKMAVAFGERVGSSPTACRSRAGQRPFGVGIGLVIESSLKTMPTRDALATVSELVAQERDRKAAVTAARPEIQPRFAQQRRAAPARDQLEICDRTARDLEVQFTATWSDGPIFELRERKMRPTRQDRPLISGIRQCYDAILAERHPSCFRPTHLCTMPCKR
jgi:hypothetical protein